MSHEAVAWVLTNSESRGLDRLVLISLAHHANRNTGACFPSMRTVAREAGVSLGKVAKSVARLVDLGELGIALAGNQRRSTRYALPFVEPLSVHHVNAAFTPGVNAQFTPGVNRTTRNAKQQQDGNVGTPHGGADVVPLHPEEDTGPWGVDGPPSEEVVQHALDDSWEQLGRPEVRTLRAASQPPRRPARLQDVERTSSGTSGPVARVGQPATTAEGGARR